MSKNVWLNDIVKINTEMLQSVLSLYFDNNVNSDCDISQSLTNKEKKYFIKLFTSKLLDCKKCCKKCIEKSLSYRDIFHILYDIYKKIDVNNDGTTECFTITKFFYEHNTQKEIYNLSNK